MFGRNNLSKDLKTQAVGLGLCQEWTDSWGKPNEQELINKYVHGLDFCIKNNWPSNEYIKENFNKELLHRNNIYVDEDIQRRNARQVVIVQGKCTGLLMYDGFTCADLYIRHDSEVTIDCSRFSKVFISVYDNAKVNVIQRDGASVYVYLHGNGCKVVADGEVMQRKSEE